MTAAVTFTDYVEFVAGAFQGVRCGLDMDFVNIVLSGMQAGMMDLGMCHVSEDTLADLVKPILGLVGIKGGPYAALGFEIAGLVSMLPQMDQFYKEHIWPIAKFALGSSLMGTMGVTTSAIANTLAMNAITVVEQVWTNHVFGNPFFEDVKIDFSAILNYLPGFGSGGYDYISNYMTHYVYGMW